MKIREEIDYKLAAGLLRTCKPLFGKEGALAPKAEWIQNAETPAHLHHQYCRGLSPSDPQGHEEQGRVPL